jgi:hypothetical protein
MFAGLSSSLGALTEGVTEAILGLVAKGATMSLTCVLLGIHMMKEGI